MLNKLLKKTPSNTYITLERSQADVSEPEIPKGLWKKCNKCGAPVYTEDVRNGLYICPKCRGYFRINAVRRIEVFMDEDSFVSWDSDLETKNPLHYAGYGKKLEDLKEKTGLDEAVLTGRAKIGGYDTVVGVCDARFLMGSMGSVVGEKITRAVEKATSLRLPVILFCCSGGARMQEGIISLMQMAKTSAALKRHSDAGLLYVSVLTDPTTGGVTASFAMLGDIILAEPGALIGFAGPRVIEQTIRQKLPEGFQRSEFLLDHGFVDVVVRREEMRSTLITILKTHKAGKLSEKTKEWSRQIEQNISRYPVTESEKKETKSLDMNVSREIGAWDRVKLSRSADRLTGLDYIQAIFTDFMEFHGDRCYKDDGAVVGGTAFFHGIPVTVIAQQKGKNTKENIVRNFGMPSPDGYRKALRLMKQAEKFNRPIICFVDTPGAFCGVEAEERGQGEAIARNLFEMSSLTVPVLSIVIGEGGSGGALAMAVADEVWMLENSIYSVLSPEGFASILWKDSKRADEAARVMRITAEDLKKLGVIERIIKEDRPANAENAEEIYKQLERYIKDFIKQYGEIPMEQLIERRYMRFRNM